ncbi:MAG: 30S ribosomal protein S27e [Candidatus Hodarchaeales archaeon]|jgi:ribosomal protein S27E
MSEHARTRSYFLEVKCECGNKQLIFSHASTKVNCGVCNEELAISGGGKAKVTAAEIIRRVG